MQFISIVQATHLDINSSIAITEKLDQMNKFQQSYQQPITNTFSNTARHQQQYPAPQANISNVNINSQQPQHQQQMAPTSPNSLVSNLMKFGLLGAIAPLPPAQTPFIEKPNLSKVNFIKLTSTSLEQYDYCLFLFTVENTLNSS